MERVLASVLLVLSLIFVGNAEAGSARCEGCNAAQFAQKAKQLGEGQHIITSFSTNQIKVFNVFDSSGGEPGVPRRLFAIEESVPADIRALFGEAHHFYALSDGTLKYGVSVKGDDLGVAGLDGATAYDIMLNSNLKAQLGDRLATGTLPGWANLDRTGELIVHGVFSMLGAGDATIEVVVVGSDGSIVVYKLTVADGTGMYQEGRSRTKNGQLIPEANSPAYQGTWTGGGAGSDLPALGSYLGGLGIPVTGSYGSGGGGSMRCTWVGTTLTCKVVPN